MAAKATETKDLLKSLGIRSVLIVDDDYDVNAELGVNVTAVIQKLDHIRETNQAEEMAKRLGGLRLDQHGLDLINIDGHLTSPDTYSTSLNQRWDELPDATRLQICGVLGLENTVEKTRRTVKAFKELVDVAEHLSVAQWQKKKSALLSDCQSDSKSIVLFDMDLKSADLHAWQVGDFSKAGAVLAQEVIDANNPYIIPGIITGNDQIKDPEDELRATDELINSNIYTAILSKDRLKKDSKLLSGIEMLITLSALIEARDLTTGAYKRALAKTLENLEAGADNFSLSVLLHIADSSMREGAAISEYVERALAESCERNVRAEVRRAGASNSKITMLNTLCMNAYDGVSSHSPNKPVLELLNLSKHELATEDRYPLLFRDVYIGAAELSSLCYPTSIGDIYEIRLPQEEPESNATDSEYYIMLQQSCSIAVRPQGRRQKGADHFVLVRLETGDQKNKGRPTIHTLPAPFEHADNESVGLWQVNFAQYRSVPAELVDLCVFDDSGYSKFELMDKRSDVPPVPDMLLEPGWIRYHQMLGEKMHKRCSHCERLLSVLGDNSNPALDRAVIGGEFGLALNQWDVSFDRATRTFDFGIRRVARISEPYASALLADFSHYHSRGSYPGNLVGGN